MKWKTWPGEGVLLAALVCCSGRSSAPQVPPVSTLGPRPAVPAESALGVVYAGPRAEADLGSSIQLLFNQALRPVDSASAVPPPSIGLEPAVAGEWQWLGSRALSFVPRAGRLPAATAFRVSVPAGTRALGGASLAQPFVFEFETPAPRIVGSDPEPGSDGKEPGSRLALRFNQRVSAAALERAARLSA